MISIYGNTWNYLVFSENMKPKKNDKQNWVHRGRYKRETKKYLEVIILGNEIDCVKKNIGVKTDRHLEIIFWYKVDHDR